MRIFKMLTLADIIAATKSKDGDIYSDLYKDVYGSRPRYAQFASVEEFDADYERLVKRLSEQLAEEKVQQARNFEDFMRRVDGIMRTVMGSDRADAVRILCAAEGIDEEEFAFYGLESLEYKFDLKYGSIARWLSE
jgi:hypothetical protein